MQPHRHNASGATDITSRYELDNGQRDNYYDVGRIKLKTGELEPTGSLRITFDFFSHGAGDYFDVDSYTGVVDYASIPSYNSDTTGSSFELRDCLDFRPRVADDSTINSGGQDRDFDPSNNASTLDVVIIQLSRFLTILQIFEFRYLKNGCTNLESSSVECLLRNRFELIRSNTFDGNVEAM